MRITLNSPGALGYQIGAGILLMMGSFLLLSLRILWPNVWIICVPMLLGIVVSSVAESSLRRGIKKNKWPKELLDPLVRWFGHPLLLIPAVLLAVWQIVYMFASNFQRGIAGFSLALFPLLTVLRVKTSLTSSPRDGGHGGDAGLGLQNAQLIHSQVWGRRGNTDGLLLSRSQD